MIRLVLAAIVLLLFIFPLAAAEIITAEQADKEARAKSTYLIDIRSPDEWKETGVAANAHKISMHNDRFLSNLETLTQGRKDAPLALICATGGRSAWLAVQLEKRGYSNVYDVSEGMMGSRAGPGWLKRNLPVSKEKQANRDSDKADNDKDKDDNEND